MNENSYWNNNNDRNKSDLSVISPKTFSTLFSLVFFFLLVFYSYLQWLLLWPILQGSIGHLAPARPAQGAPSKEKEIEKKKKKNE